MLTQVKDQEGLVKELSFSHNEVHVNDVGNLWFFWSAKSFNLGWLFKLFNINIMKSC